MIFVPMGMLWPFDGNTGIWMIVDNQVSHAATGDAAFQIDTSTDCALVEVGASIGFCG